MARRFLQWLGIAACCLFAAAAHAGSLLALCYHDVVETMADNPQPESVDVATLAGHFSWLKENGYQVISFQQYVEAASAGKPLPEKSVLLTFDDGYRSFYGKVYPLLKEFGYPAVLAIVGEWVDAEMTDSVTYDNRLLPRRHFVTWPELREMVGSGLVEVASHSYGLHKGVQGNPQGNSQPAATTRIYNPADDTYESDEAHAARIEQDLRRNADLLEQQLGVRPRVMVWPYGRYSRATVEIAERAGMRYSFTLDDRPNAPSAPGLVHRRIVRFNPSVVEFAWSYVYEPRHYQPIRVVHADLDYIADPDPRQQERNLSLFLDRIKELEPTTVFLQAFSDIDGRGHAKELYFPNRHMPVRADLFNRAAWQLKTRTGVEVYAWLPLLAYDLPEGHPSRHARVETMSGKEGGYLRLSPFSEQVRKTVYEIFEDLAKHSYIDGILIHDDATLSDFEDASDLAKAQYALAGLPPDLDEIRRTPDALEKWTQLKTRTLTETALGALAAASRYRPNIKSARNIYAPVVLSKEPEAWFAQSYEDNLRAFDYTAVMAMPYMEGATEPLKWLAEMVDTAKARAGGLRKTLFELQATDWRTQSKISSEELAQQFRLLQLKGALNFGYYPDDMVRQHPDIGTIKPYFSLRQYPRR